MVKVWLRIVGAVTCFAVTLYLTADGSHTYRYEWLAVIILLAVGVVLTMDAILARVRIAIARANERRRKL